MSSPSIAVIGGGIAGCSTAWFLRQALGERAALTVYERDAQLGGRLATLDVGGTQVESGGTIIHETNRYLASFVDQLALERVEPHQREEGGAESVGVWDGHRFAFRTHKSALVTRLAAVWRFGVIAPMRLQRSVARGVEQWNQVYELLERGAAFDSPLALCSELGLADLLQKDGRQWLADSGVRGPFVDQYTTPVGRIMYGQDVSMNALATSIALAGAGLAGTLFSVGGGNCRVCDGLVRDAGATLQIGTEVAGVSRAGGRFTVQLSDGRSVSHDVIVLATPGGPAALTFSGVELPESALRVRPFQITWATFVKGTPRADYFGLARASDLPDAVLTVEDDTIPFSSLGLVATSPDGAPVYKLFSREPVAESLLDELFSSRDVVEQIRWEGYPVLRPSSGLPSFRLDDGLYWVNAMEFAVSTMETEAVAARNVANLVAAQYHRIRSDRS
jgi:prenylcysteine oxidase/farnesylcysteine lyase